MNEAKVKQLISLLDQQMEDQENLAEELTKADAMAQLAVSGDFLDHPKEVVNGYLWALSDAVDRARRLSEQMLDTLLKNGFDGVHT